MTGLNDRAVELSVLSTVLDTPEVLRRLLTDERLRPEHFASDQHAIAFDAIVQLADRGEHPDRHTFTAELERSTAIEPQRLANAVFATSPELVSLTSYARLIRDLHRRRQLKLAAEILADAADRGDPDRLAEAEAILTQPDETEPSTWTGRQLAERFADRLDESTPEMFNWPFSRMDTWTGGGLRRKQIVLIGGWTSNGKSVLYDQILEGLAGQGLAVHSYINEMSEQERMDRTVARLSGVPFSRVHARRLEPDHQKLILEALPNVKVGITECAGWSAHDIARHIRWNRWDVAGIDIIHEIAHREERDLAEIAQILRSAAKQVGCALIACVHLNDNRVTTPRRPMPVLRDVRGSGMLVRGADIVLMVHRDDDADGVPQPDGVLLAPKIRNGQPNVMGVVFEAAQMRFVPKVSEPAW